MLVVLVLVWVPLRLPLLLGRLVVWVSLRLPLLLMRVPLVLLLVLEL